MKPDNEHIFKSLHDLEIVNDIKEIFYANTGMVISIHYTLSKDDYDFYPKKERNEFCQLVQSTQDGLRLCRGSDRKGFLEARRRKSYTMYECHAGLTDIVIPLICFDREIASIYTGQIITRKPVEGTFHKLHGLSARLGIPFEKLEKAFRKVKVVGRDRLRSNVRFLSLMANYIITVESELDLQRRIMQKDRELFLKEKEKVKLENELKQLTISILEFDRNMSKTASPERDTKTANRHIVSRAKLFITSNFDKNIMLGDVARAVYISPNYFSTLFKSITGHTFSTYLTKTRIDRAEEMLMNTDLPIKEIVSSVGFRDYNYFNRVFKRQNGVAPAQFRFAGSS